MSEDELLAAVTSDVVFLQEEWDSTVDEQSLRRSSNVLRNLLVEDLLGRAWRAAGFKGEPAIEAIDLENHLAGLETNKIAFASAGGGTSEGALVAGALLYEGVMPESVIKARAEREPQTRKFKLSQFLSSPAVVYEGERICRRDVVKYVANKLGGAHFDTRRKTDEHTYRLLDAAMKAAQIGERRLVYFELLSIGQALANAEDTRRFREEVRRRGG
jgi:hypothetical protein